MKRLVYLILILTIGALSSCEYQFIEDVKVEYDGPVSFSEQLEPIFKDKCVSCHSNTNPILTTGNAYSSLTEGNYVNIQNPEQSRVYQKTNSGHPGGNSALSPTELAMLLKWIEDGANDN